MLNLLRASEVVDPADLVVVVGFAAVREVVDVVDVVDRAEGAVGGLAADLFEETVLVRDSGFFSAAPEPATLDRRSRVDVVDFAGALVDVLEVLPASDIRLADPEIPLFSSPELRTDLDFSSAELLTEVRD